MACNNCGGQMITERNFYEGHSCDSLRCIQCGEVIDEVILENREISAVGNLKEINKRIRENGGRKKFLDNVSVL